MATKKSSNSNNKISKRNKTHRGGDFKGNSGAKAGLLKRGYEFHKKTNSKKGIEGWL